MFVKSPQYNEIYPNAIEKNKIENTNQIIHVASKIDVSNNEFVSTLNGVVFLCCLNPF